MAINSIITESRAVLPSGSKSSGANSQPQQPPLELGKGDNKLGNKNFGADSSANNSAKSNDNISLSSNALQLLSANESEQNNNQDNLNPSLQFSSKQPVLQNNNSDDFSLKFKRTQNIAVELKGIDVISGSKDLSEVETLRSQSLKSEISYLLEDSELTNSDITKIASDAIDSSRRELSPILDRLNNFSEVTGNEFAKINDANKLFNNFNGLGIEGFGNLSFENTDRLQSLQKQSTDFLDSKGEDILTPNELDYANRLQGQINDLSGFKLNINDAIGPFGLVI